MKHFSPIDIKSTIKRDTAEFSKLYSRQPEKPNKSFPRVDARKGTKGKRYESDQSIKNEGNRDASSSNVIKIFTIINRQTKCGAYILLQTDKSIIYRSTDPMLSVWGHSSTALFSIKLLI